VSARWRRWAWIGLGAVAALNALVFVVYTVPKRLEERSLAARVASLRSEVERDRATVARLRRRTEAVQANAADATRFYDGLGSRRELLAVLAELQRTSRELGLRVGRRSYEPKEVRGLPLTRYSITMPLSGTYRQLTSFLDRIERSPHFLTADEVSLRKRGAGGEADLDVVMSAYVRSDLRATDGAAN
jgi:Tfp pilus assembly protein PilO